MCISFEKSFLPLNKGGRNYGIVLCYIMYVNNYPQRTLLILLECRVTINHKSLYQLPNHATFSMNSIETLSALVLLIQYLNQINSAGERSQMNILTELHHCLTKQLLAVSAKIKCLVFKLFFCVTIGYSIQVMSIVFATMWTIQLPLGIHF